VTDTVLHAKNVTKRFGGLVAVHDIDFTIPQGSIVSLIGPNGAGKTTFFNIIAGIYDPSAGVIEFKGQDMIAKARRAWIEPLIWLTPPLIFGVMTVLVSNSGASKSVVGVGALITVLTLLTTMVTGVARPPSYQRFMTNFGVFRSARPNDMVVAGLGRTFQNIRLFQNMSAMDNVLVGMHSRLKTTWLDALLSTPRDRREERESRVKAETLLTLVGLKGRSGEVAKNLPTATSAAWRLPAPWPRIRRCSSSTSPRRA
jgi:ABC-type branched-subunit amino acid transport system ATPase component